MARIKVEGVESLMLAIKNASELPENVTGAMLQTGGEVIQSAQKKQLHEMGLVASGKLEKSIKVVKKKNFSLIYPSGTHHVSSTGTVTTVGDVGFIQEFGAEGRNIKAKQWMRIANEKSADKAVDEMEEILNAYLDKCGL